MDGSALTDAQRVHTTGLDVNMVAERDTTTTGDQPKNWRATSLKPSLDRYSAAVKILVGAGPRGETFARAVRRKGANFEDLEQFLKVQQTLYGNMPVYCD